MDFQSGMVTFLAMMIYFMQGIIKYNQLPSTLVIKQGSIKKQVGLSLTINEYKWLSLPVFVQKCTTVTGSVYHVQYSISADF